MRLSRGLSALALGAALAAAPAVPAAADGVVGSGYTAFDLLRPCQEADNDARNGVTAEMECEQYILGFLDAMSELGGIGPLAGICPPAVNTADEVRWAYMRWVHSDWTKRRAMPAAAAVLLTMHENWPCPE